MRNYIKVERQAVRSNAHPTGTNGGSLVPGDHWTGGENCNLNVISKC